MGRGEQNESYRAQILRRLKNKYSSSAPPEVLEAEKVIARFREQETKDRQTETRLGLELPNPHSCPQCFYLHDTNSMLKSVPHAHSIALSQLLKLRRASACLE